MSEGALPWITAFAAHLGERDERVTAASLRARWPEAPARIGRMDRGSLQSLSVARAVLGALALTEGEREGVAVILGTSLGCMTTTGAFHRTMLQGGREGASPLLFGYTVSSAPVGEVAIAFGLRGHQTVVMAGRCSGVEALCEARRALALGRAGSALVLASDVVSGEDRAREAAVALLLERPEVALSGGRAPLAVLEHARAVRTPEAWGRAADTGDHLGASGLVELCAWLASPEGALSLTVTDGDRLGTLRARAWRGP